MTAVGRLRAIPSWQITLGAALLALGFLIAAQAASEHPRVRYTTQERTPLLETTGELQTQQDALKARILGYRDQIQEIEGQGAGSADLVRQLNADLEKARIAAGLIPLTGTGIVLQLEDSQEPVPPDGSASDYLVGSRDIRAVVEQLWSVGAEAIAVNGERITTTTAIIDVGPSVLVNSSYQAPPYQVTALGPPELYQRLSAAPGFRGFPAGSCRSLRDTGVVRRARIGRHARVHRHGDAALLATRVVCRAVARRDRRPLGAPRQSGEMTMHRLRSQVTIAAVAFVLGLLVVVQARSQAGDTGLAQLSAQDLTVLVANLNARNDQLRTDASSLESELATLTQNRARGDASVDEITADLRRVRAYAGLDPVGGPGVAISVSGPIDGPGVGELINELRNAGAEAIAVDGARVVTGVVVSGGAGEAGVDGSRLPDVFELAAIGAPDKLTGSLTRSGGVIAQLAATQPKVTVTVTPVDRLQLAATTRVLVPAHGHPRL